MSGYNNFISGYTFMDELNKSFYVDTPNIDVSSKAKHIFAIYGDDDPNIPQSYLYEFANMIGGESVCVHGAGHFNEAAGYTQCDIVRDILKDIFEQSN